MNKIQRIERIEAQRRRRVATPSDIADAEQRFRAKLDAIAARMRASGEVQEVGEATPEIRQQYMETLRGMVQQARADYERQRQQPKAANWLKLQGKQNRH